jgi:hypothetical protein
VDVDVDVDVTLSRGYQVDRASYHYTHIERQPLVFLAVVCENNVKRRRHDDPDVLAFIKRVAGVLRLQHVLSMMKPD